MLEMDKNKIEKRWKHSSAQKYQFWIIAKSKRSAEKCMRTRWKSDTISFAIYFMVVLLREWQCDAGVLYARVCKPQTSSFYTFEKLVLHKFHALFSPFIDSVLCVCVVTKKKLCNTFYYNMNARMHSYNIDKFIGNSQHIQTHTHTHIILYAMLMRKLLLTRCHLERLHSHMCI